VNTYKIVIEFRSDMPLTSSQIEDLEGYLWAQVEEPWERREDGEMGIATYSTSELNITTERVSA
jgi:hypothetical protein